MIILEDLKKTYIINKQETITVFDGVNLEFPSTGFFSLTGVSGSGKTTLFNIIGGIENRFEGKVNSFGFNLKNCNLDVYRKNVVGFIFQDYNLIDNLSIYENLKIVLINENLDPESIDLRIDEVLKRVNLNNLKSRFPNQLSGGETQRVAIARAILRNVNVILADEPTGNLDNDNAREVLDKLKEISKDHLVIMVSHNMMFANEYSDKIIEIGKLKDKDIHFPVNRQENEIFTIQKERIHFSKFDFIYPFKILMKNYLSTLIISFLLTLLFFVSFVSIKTINTEEIDILSNYIASNDSNIYRIHKTKFSESSTGQLAIDKENIFFEVYYAYNVFNPLVEKYDNVVFTNEIVFNYYDKDNIERPYWTDINLLSSEIQYDLGDITGRLPEEKNEIVITDYLAMVFFNSEDVIGRKISSSPQIKYPIEFTIVGIIETNYEEDNISLDWSTMRSQFEYRTHMSVLDNYSYEETMKYIQSFTLIDTYMENENQHLLENSGYLNIICDNCVKNYKINDSFKMMNTDNLSGKSPVLENEIILREDILKDIIPANETEINRLLNGEITWDEFELIVRLPIFTKDIAVDLGEDFWDGIIPEDFVITGIYEDMEDSKDKLYVSPQLIQKINESYPFYRIGIKVLNPSNNLEEVYDDLQDKNILGAYGADTSNSKMVFNSNGSYFTYVSIYEFESKTQPIFEKTLIISIVITLLFLILNGTSAQKIMSKNNGVLLSLGISKAKIISLIIIESIYLTIIPIIISVSLFIITSNTLSNYIFSSDVNYSIYTLSANEIGLYILLAVSLVFAGLIPQILNLIQKSPIELIKNK